MLRWAALDATGAVDALVTTRAGGTSRGDHESLNLGLHVDDDPVAVVENRRRAAAALGTDLDHLVVAQQCHGDRVVVVDTTDAGRGATTTTDAVADTDALVTTATDITIAVLVADCVPIVLVDPAAGVVGCAHAGWRGTAAGIAARTVATMAELGARADRLVVGIGPAVDPATYVVGPEVAAAIGGVVGDRRGEVLDHTGPRQWRCDLVAANTIVLGDAGVDVGKVHAMPLTTADPRLFSHRRGDRGRFAVLARLTTGTTT